jgi:rubrerythrin
MQITEEMRQRPLAYQKSEITEHRIYGKLAGAIKSPENRRVLEHIVEDELRHYQQWRAYTQLDVPPDRWGR